LNTVLLRLTFVQFSVFVGFKSESLRVDELKDADSPRVAKKLSAENIYQFRVRLQR